MLMQSHIGGFGVGSDSGVNWATWNGSLDGSLTQLGSSVTMDYDPIILKLSDDKFIVLFVKSPSSTAYIYGVVFSTSGTSITSIGSLTQLNSIEGTSTYISACIVDSSRVVITYMSSNTCYGRILSISGTSISSSAAYSIVGSISDNTAMDVVLINTNKAVMVYTTTPYGGGNRTLRAITIPISGTSIGTPGTQYTGEIVTGQDIDVAVIDSSNVLVIYAYDTSNVKSVVLSIGSTTVTANTAVTISSSAQVVSGYSLISITKLTDSTYIATYGYASGTRANIVTISGTVITIGNSVNFPYEFRVHRYTSNHNIRLNNTQAMLIGAIQDGTNYPACQVLTVNGENISAATPVTITTTSAQGEVTSIAYRDDNRMVSLSRNGSIYASAKVLKQV